jgi:sterol desaturase/sphingolipid hydroxylase (fatty acid hydroxylase superfamily)
MGPWLASLSLPALAGVVAGAFLGFTVITTGLGFAAERALRHRRIWAVPLDPGQYRFELIGNLKFLSVQIAAAIAVIHFGWLRFGDASVFLTFAGVFAGFQAYYFLLHWALHRRSLVRFHRWHHRSRVTTPLSGQSTGFVEAIGYAVGYYALPALASQLAPISAEGWALYIVFNVFANIFGHSNVEMMPALGRKRVVSVFAPPYVYHALHHARWVGHYGFGSTGLDRLLGTEFPDWQALHRQIDAGRPLESLRVRDRGA